MTLVGIVIAGVLLTGLIADVIRAFKSNRTVQVVQATTGDNPDWTRLTYRMSVVTELCNASLEANSEEKIDELLHQMEEESEKDDQFRLLVKSTTVGLAGLHDIMSDFLSYYDEQLDQRQQGSKDAGKILLTHQLPVLLAKRLLIIEAELDARDATEKKMRV